jgi:hypothetical protein
VKRWMLLLLGTSLACPGLQPRPPRAVSSTANLPSQDAPPADLTGTAEASFQQDGSQCVETRQSSLVSATTTDTNTQAPLSWAVVWCRQADGNVTTTAWFNNTSSHPVRFRYKLNLATTACEASDWLNQAISGEATIAAGQWWQHAGLFDSGGYQYDDAAVGLCLTGYEEVQEAPPPRCTQSKLSPLAFTRSVQGKTLPVQAQVEWCQQPDGQVAITAYFKNTTDRSVVFSYKLVDQSTGCGAEDWLSGSIFGVATLAPDRWWNHSAVFSAEAYQYESLAFCLSDFRER